MMRKDKYSVMCDGMNCKIRDTCKNIKNILITISLTL